MKIVKILLTLILLFAISSCTNQNKPEKLVPIYTVDLGGKESFENITYVNVELFDSIDKRTLDKDNYQVEVKKNIFDLEKIYSSNLPIYSNDIRQSSSGFFNSEDTKGIQFKSISTDRYVMNGFPIASDYFNEEFVFDITKLENNEVDAYYIYDKYGTEFAKRCFTYYDTKLKVGIESLDKTYDKYKNDFLNYLFNDNPTLQDKTKYEAIYKCFNIKYSYSGYSSIYSREDFNSTLYNMIYGEFSFVDSTTTLYDALLDTYPNAIQKLKAVYSKFK